RRGPIPSRLRHPAPRPASSGLTAGGDGKAHPLPSVLRNGNVDTTSGKNHFAWSPSCPHSEFVTTRGFNSDAILRGRVACAQGPLQFLHSAQIVQTPLGGKQALQVCQHPSDPLPMG